ncbi:MAG: ABC transporter ATP-binding protein [Pseudohongiellaceae bacterium]
MTAFVEFERVGHAYPLDSGGSVTALEDVSFTLHKHEFVAVVGPSGCGKSTLLRLLSGLIKPAMGNIRLFGKPLEGPQQEVGIVFQKPTLLPWLTVLDNVLFPIRHQRGRVSKADRHTAQQLLAMVGLAGEAQRLPSALSGGMQQRVAIARALLLDPDILIMDEPFSALDALTRETMGFELLRIWNERPKTVLFITHSISEAVLLADRVLIMSARPGRLEETVSVNLPRPRTPDSIHLPHFADCTQILRSHLYRPVAEGG